MTSLNATPSANRIHIGVFGKTNSGKSTLVNTLTGQEVSIVSDVMGTTTDPVQKAMEIYPLGPCVIIDTAGYNDTTTLGAARTEKTRQMLEKTDIALLVMSMEEYLVTDDIGLEREWVKEIRKKNIPLLLVLNLDVDGAAGAMAIKMENAEAVLGKELGVLVHTMDATESDEVPRLREQLARMVPENRTEVSITGSLVGPEDTVLLVMPQDIQAPKGRLILPQVQTIRDLLDKQCMVICVTTDQLESALQKLREAPKLIITDSQEFKTVYEKKPKESMLTSFSVLFAAYKGDIQYYVEGAKAIESLTEQSRVLIAECCTHAPLAEDIGRVKIPRMLRKRLGEGLTIDMVSGTDYPKDLKEYDLIIQCGACMFNRSYVMSRIDRARQQQVPMTNYGVAIAHLTGILEQIVIN